MLDECDASERDALKRDTSETAAPCELRGAAVCVSARLLRSTSPFLVPPCPSSSTFILSRTLRSALSFLAHLVLLHRSLSPYLFLSFLILPHPSSSLPFLPPDACFIFATTVTRALHNETFQEMVPKQDELVLYDWR